MRRIWIILLCLISCNHKENTDANINKYANSIATRSNSVIKHSIDNQIMILKEKLYKPETKDSAEVYFPKAKRCIEITDNMVGFLQNLLTVVREKGGLDNKDSLFEKLKEYNENLLNIDSDATQVIFKGVILSIDTIGCLNKISKEQFNEMFINGLSKQGSITLLNSIVTDVLTNATLLLRYDIDKCRVFYESYSVIQAIVTQNSTYFKANEKLEITAGLGIFSSASKPIFSINGKKVPVVLSAEGVLNYKLRVSKDTGRHTVRVKVSFTKPNREVGSLEKELVYFVE